LEKTSKIIKSNRQSNSIMSAKRSADKDLHGLCIRLSIYWISNSAKSSSISAGLMPCYSQKQNS